MLHPSIEEVNKDIKKFSVQSYVKNRYPEFYEVLMGLHISDGGKFTERLWTFYHPGERPICPVCGSLTRFSCWSKGYNEFCCALCAKIGSRERANRTMIERYGGVGLASEETREKIQKTCAGRYGSIWAMSSPEVSKRSQEALIERHGGVGLASEDIKRRHEETMMSRYGTTHALCNEDIRTKTKNTNIERYGVDSPFKSPAVKEKIKNTNIERYGVDSPFKSPSIQEKIKNTNKERYGVDSPFKSPAVREKTKNTNIKRYGVDNPFKSPSIQEKIKNTNIERYGVDNPFKSDEVQSKCLDSIKSRILKCNDNLIDVQFNTDHCPTYIFKCGDAKCELCADKQFSLTRNQYYNRSMHNIELCPIKNPLCMSSNTSIEAFIKNILDSYNIHYECNNRSILGGQELDIYIPSKKIAIECNGVFWHSEAQKPKRYHINKRNMCLQRDIQLISMWEDQIITKPDIVKSIILSKLGIYDRRIYARCCIVKEIPSKESRTFLDDNHLQGPVNGSIRFGLYYNDELVAIMVFGRSRKCLNESGSWELYRYCTARYTTIVGGASKLFKSFIKKYHPSEIVSFSSNDISNGELYIHLGFEKAKKESISYWYIDRSMHRYHRYKFRRSELVKMGYDSSLSESYITSSMGLMKIYDSGQSKWIWVGE